MKSKTFKGGVHPPYHKDDSRYLAIEELGASKEMIFPLSQHIGAPAQPVVKVGDRVFEGQLIAAAQGNVSANVHSSVSGTVTAIKLMPHPNGTEAQAIVVENDFLNEVDASVKPHENIDKLTAEEIIEIVRNAGIVGMGGATFPTHIKLSPPPQDSIDTVIVNGAECEPYITSDHRVMLENTENVLKGLKVCMKALNVSNGVVAVEDNKLDAVETLTAAAKAFDGITVMPLETKYPQGSEKHIIKAVTGREVPSGKLPSSVGVVVLNVDTVNSVYRAVTTGMPLTTRIVTVGGDAVKNCRNYRVRIGTPVKDVIDAAGGFAKQPTKIILGGPMMGTAISTTDVPVIKGTGAILSFTDEALKTTPDSKCMRCGKCVEACPMHLQPFLLGAYGRKGDLEKLEKLSVMDCMECGVCSYLCPAHRGPLQYIRISKLKINNQKKKEVK